MQIWLYITIVLSFSTTALITPYWISRAKKAGLVGADMHKLDKKEVAELGGIPVIFGFLIGILFFVAFRIFILDSSSNILETLALLCTILIIAIIGIIDDILGWKIGLRRWQKPLLTILAALPMMVINVGHSAMKFPLIGQIDFGIFFPLIITPIAIVGAANGFNMIAGYNGIESGQGIIILTTIGYIAAQRGNGWISMIAFLMVASLIGFYYFNRFPSRIFPGDTLTYSVGALIAALSILGNMEKVGIILFAPYFIELVLKIRGRFKQESFSRVTETGILDLIENKIYSLQHLSIYFLKRLKIRSTESMVVYTVFSFQMVFVLLALVL